MQKNAYSREPNLDDEGKLLFSLRDLIKLIWINMWPLMKVNFCFLLFCIPLVTIPAGITAMYAISANIISGKPVEIFKTFKETIRTEFFNSFMLGVLGILLLLAGGLSTYFYFSRMGASFLWAVPGAIGAALIILVLSILPAMHLMLAKVEIEFKDAFRNAFYLSIACARCTLPAVAITIFFAFVEIRYMLYGAPAIVALGFSLPTVIIAYLHMNSLQRSGVVENWQ